MPAVVVDAEPADPMALDNFRLSDAVKQQLKAKSILTLFPIQVRHTGSRLHSKHLFHWRTSSATSAVPDVSSASVICSLAGKGRPGCCE